MRQYIIALFALVTLLAGCAKEEALTPSNADTNWFEIKDKPGDPLDHKIYEVYVAKKISIFYNDSIGTQYRGLDANGQPINFTMRLNLNYSINGGNATSNILKKIILCEDRDAIMEGVKFVEEHLLARVPEQFYMHSILLLDSLYEQQYQGGTKKMFIAHSAINTFAISGVNQIATMDNQQKTQYADEILTLLAVNHILKNSATELKLFYDVSYDPITQVSYYGQQVRKPSGAPWDKPLAQATWEVYGFLDYDRTKSMTDGTEDPTKWWYVLPKQEVDVPTFINAVLAYSEADFNAKYAIYPKVLEKFKIMRTMVAELGFQLK